MKKITEELNSLAAIIDAKEDYLPSIEEFRNDGHPTVQEVHGYFHYVVKERDVEFTRLIFDKKEELFYEVFKGVTFSMACDFAVKNKIEGEDSRRLIFKEQYDLLNRLNSSWGKKIKEEQEEILLENPYVDN